jgi:transcriptional regulator with XRE-family HTH domain
LIDACNENNTVLAAAIGVKDPTVGRWINGATEPKLSHVIKLADHYGLTLDQLFRDSVDLPETIEVRIPSAGETRKRRGRAAVRRAAQRKVLRESPDEGREVS